MTQVQLFSEAPQKNQRPQQKSQQRPNQRFITGGRPNRRQFGSHVPPPSFAEKMEEQQQAKKRLLAQEEIQQSSASLVKSTISKLARG